MFIYFVLKAQTIARTEKVIILLSRVALLNSSGIQARTATPRRLQVLT
jgi:hypothetical protein